MSHVAAHCESVEGNRMSVVSLRPDEGLCPIGRAGVPGVPERRGVMQ